MSGTVNIARDLFDHPAFKAAPFSEREAWLWIIMEASWKPRQKRIGHIVVEVGRGQLAASIRYACRDSSHAPEATASIEVAKALPLAL